MSKEEAIEYFRRWCLEPGTEQARKNTVAYQTARNIWQAWYKQFVIRIVNHDGKTVIAVRCNPEYGEEKKYNANKFMYNISFGEYQELELLYKGDYVKN